MSDTGGYRFSAKTASMATAETDTPLSPILWSPGWSGLIFRRSWPGDFRGDGLDRDDAFVNAGPRETPLQRGEIFRFRFDGDDPPGGFDPVGETGREHADIRADVDHAAVCARRMA